MIAAIIAVAITANGSPTFKPQNICVVNIQTGAEQCEKTHSVTFTVTPGRYAINVDGRRASLADAKPAQTTTVILSQ